MGVPPVMETFVALGLGVELLETGFDRGFDLGTGSGARKTADGRGVSVRSGAENKPPARLG
jgi:hypothetical protein